MAAVLVALALAACSSGGDDNQADAGTTSSRPATTTTTSPEDAFLSEVDDQYTFVENGGPEATLAAARELCSTLDAGDGASTDDAPNDSPETDAFVSAEVKRMALAVWLDALDDDELGYFVLDLTGQHLCPEHEQAIDEFVGSRMASAAP